MTNQEEASHDNDRSSSEVHIRRADFQSVQREQRPSSNPSIPVTRSAGSPSDSEIESDSRAITPEVIQGDLAKLAADIVQSKSIRSIDQLADLASWEGVLPPPEVFRNYEPDVQQRWLQWNDGYLPGEPERQDKLVDAQIDQAKQGQARLQRRADP